MSETTEFERSHSILIAAPAERVFDYVSNPQSWPEWLAASHRLESPDRPLRKGETFGEEWHTRKGAARLDWVVTACDRPRLWRAETGAPFTGPIVVEYRCEPAGDGQTRYTRTVRNPARPKPMTEAMIARMDAEAAAGLANIRKSVEGKMGRAGRQAPP